MVRGKSLLLPPLLLSLALLSAIPQAHAQRHIVIYRCTDAHGALTIQNDVPCPKGSKQKAQTVDVPPPMPAYEPRAERMPQVVAAEKKQEAAEIAAVLPVPDPDEAPKPPPALYRCTTWQQDNYLTEDATPANRCAPINVVGLDGSSLHGAAQACQNVVDTCTPVPDDDLCKAWQQRVDEAKFRWKFAGDDHARELEYETYAATLRNSDCAE